MRRPPARQVPTFVAAPPPAAGRAPQPAPAETLDDWPVDGLRGSSRTQAATSRGVHGLLWTLLIGAVALGVLGLANLGSRRAAPAAAAPAVPLVAAAPPGGCAELLVSAWLAGDATTLGTLVSADVPRLPARQRAATRTYTVSAQADPASTAGWSYVIGADVVTLDKQGRSTGAGVQFFAVTLTRPAAGAAAGGTCAGWAAPTLPAQVAGLAPAGRQELAYGRALPVTGQPIPDTLNPFFTALLAGGPEIERYLAPGTTIAAVTPAPYTAVRVERLSALKDAEVGTGQTLPADGTRVQLLATVAAKVGDQPGEWRLTYPLTLAVRGGRWEITAIDTTPAVPTPTPSSSTRPAVIAPSARTGAPSAPASGTPGTPR
ncbi:conjugative transposon protein TcpC [Krasilnikovia cinnamomea]|uniref:Conjugative transposon protein TcpC n=1 Tax=Krasilnikovia cinnamomea TaxID=349313 RepID=A0A4Q7Z9V8_9ACTN|nr:conjugal transfer protein [Krasilnikovia cinnamomea]RZU46675.1 conjugative transposon protein TcpC [Krasilnikovia cinnamomea]